MKSARNTTGGIDLSYRQSNGKFFFGFSITLHTADKQVEKQQKQLK